MRSFHALVRGRVSYRQGDQKLLRVPLGWCTAETFESYVSLAWTDSGIQQTAVLTAEAFEAYVEAESILIADSAESKDPPRASRSQS